MQSDFGHDFRSGADCKSNRCPLCQFKSKLSAMIGFNAAEAEHTWNKKVGQIADLCFDAVWAIHRTRREGFTEAHDNVANAWDAANNLTTLYAALDELRETFGVPPLGEPVPEGEELENE